VVVRASAFLCCALLVASCVTYTSEETGVATMAAEARSRKGGRFSFATAVGTALRQNAGLQSLEASARAAGADVPATDALAEWDGHDRMLGLMVDPVALLRLGARGAAVDLAGARGAEALAELAEARWRVVAAIAEAFAVDAALQGLTVPRIDVDPMPFVQAGLASRAAAAQVRAAQGGARAEALALEAERSANLAGLRRLLGLDQAAPIELEAVPEDFPPLPQPDDENLLRRPDLALALARYHVADAAFRRAVADQYPAVMLGPDIPLRGGSIDAFAVLRLPVGAAAIAGAARDRRTAARATLLESFLAVSSAAQATRSAQVAAAARAEATAASAEASAAALAIANTALQVEVDAFDPVADKALMVVRDTTERRDAVTAAARARVRRAVAYGWPLAESGR
jgi:outer membrane protein TolC